MTASDDPVRDQYEAYPYPQRAPRDEARRLIVGSPSNLAEVDHYLFAGRGNFHDGFQALVAGGGTGDAVVMLAQQLADCGGNGHVTYIDLSDSSSATAAARVAARGLNNVSFHRLSLLDLPQSGLGPFDYIDCCGVLHHLEYPLAGLTALTTVLKPHGGLGLMLYGRLGRTGVYPLQDVLRTIGGGMTLAEQVPMARRLLDELPDSNWLKRNDGLNDHLGDDAGLVDLLLHPRDRAYQVGDIADLVSAAGLAVTGFVQPAQYEPKNYVADAEIRRRLARLSWIDRCAAAERLVGNLRTHVFYAAPIADAGTRLASPDDAASVPYLHDIDAATLVRRAGTTIAATLDRFTFRHALTAEGAAILGLIDGQRSLRDIHTRWSRSRQGADWLAFMATWRGLYDALNGIGKMYLRRGA